MKICRCHLHRANHLNVHIDNLFLAAGPSAPEGLLPISLSFRAARIVAAKRIAYFRCSSMESSSGNGEDRLWRWLYRSQRETSLAEAGISHVSFGHGLSNG
jgi:hypothetical protein